MDRIKILVRAGHGSAASLEEDANAWLAQEGPHVHIRDIKLGVDGSGSHRVLSVMIWYASSPPGRTSRLGD